LLTVDWLQLVGGRYWTAAHQLLLLVRHHGNRWLTSAANLWRMKWAFSSLESNFVSETSLAKVRDGYFTYLFACFVLVDQL